MRRIATVLGACLAAAVTSGVTASAAPADFYEVPASALGGAPGTVVDTQPYPPLLSIPNQQGPWPSGAQRIMYRTTDAHGAATAASGTYFDASLPWIGAGPRPLVVLGPGTQGQGDQCAPSRLFQDGVHYNAPLDFAVEYEVLQVHALLSRGIDVVVTDYQGLGTAGMHSYVDRRAQGHAMLDAARAVKALPGSRIGDDNPIGFWGYSQGGGAAASAAEMQPSYAPDLDVRGTYAGGPPADLRTVAAALDGGLATGLLGYAVNSIYAGYPETRADIDGALAPAGRQALDEIAAQCVPETIARYGLHRTTEWTKDGRSLAELIDALPSVSAVVDEQRIGRSTPGSPVLIVQGRNDDLIPHTQATRLAADWCAQGATVEFRTEEIPPIAPGFVVGHGLPMVSGLPSALDWMTDRFDGVPARSGCSN
ncbi:lipase family protein [Prescottella equi]|uniref:Alpha/beta fold hydrolase n=2 Tax=Rhodococcus hoagii TaxID=43767 RepID=A0AAE5IPC4_RHOHA|nr:lipase family protein [Prescottella equi]MBM4626161.1 alpha/beta fold hydrolase [Prescottella equi]MBM4627577.1 alpha/beta fold hydrolase [Prescottella equi]MBM4627582.1 alpha/beta fold hydrolase [Prescottella equi]ORL25986.1 lipase [Prescottella equi]ORM24345.1 lipase [Prescottella equi]